MIIRKKLFNKYPKTKITFIDKQNNKAWPKWKTWEESSEKERTEANLRCIFPNEIILDLEEKEQLNDIENEVLKIIMVIQFGKQVLEVITYTYF